MPASTLPWGVPIAGRPFGNGGPHGLPSALAPLTDPRTYRTGAADAPTSSSFTALGSPYSFQPLNVPGFLSPYARAVASTPGLTGWWRLGASYTAASDNSATPPYFLDSAGDVSLRQQGAGTPKLVVGLIPGDPDPAVDLNGGYLDGFNYFETPSGNETYSAEGWMYYKTSTADTALMGEWVGAAGGWMLYVNGTTLSLYAQSQHIDAAAALKVGALHHIVGVWGGLQSPNPDYVSRLYVNGVQVASGNFTSSSTLQTVSRRFEIGQYSNGGGTNPLAAVVDELAVYNRMLQPAEVTQHYTAAFQRG
jgi:hypothetical protein